MVKIKVKVEENRSIGEDRSRCKRYENGEEDIKKNDARLAHGENMLFRIVLCYAA